MSKNKFWNEHRKSHYSWLLAIFVSLMAAYSVGIATVIPAMVLWAPCTFMVLVVADTVPSQDLLKRASNESRTVVARQGVARHVAA